MSKRFTDEFKIQSVKQVSEQGYSVASVSKRLGVSTSTLYNWIEKFGEASPQHHHNNEQEARIKQLEKELKRVKQERDILKEATVFFASESKKNTRL